MRITTLELVEDSNEFAIAELEDLGLSTPFTIGGSEIKVAGELVGIKRVDRIPADVTIDLPTRQAQNLVDLGKAKLADA